MHPFEKVMMELMVCTCRKRDGLVLNALLAEVHDAMKELL
jgi:hypothetical protein